MSNKIEDRFSDFWEKIDQNWQKSEKKGKKKHQRSRIPNYIGNIIVNAILLWVFFKLPDWANFLTGAYANIVWVFNILFVATMVLNFLFLFFDKIWFRIPMQLVLNIIAFFAWFNLYHIWPFDFSQFHNPNIERWVHIGIIVILVCIAIGIIAEFGRLIYKLIKGEER
jgi:hypothetical protein